MYCILTLMRLCNLCTTTQLEAYFSKSVPNMHSSKRKVDDFCDVDKIISTSHTCSIEVACIQILLKVASSVISFVWHCSIDRRELSRRFITLTSGRLGLEKRFQILQRLKMLSAYAVSVNTSSLCSNNSWNRPRYCGVLFTLFLPFCLLEGQRDKNGWQRGESDIQPHYR